VTGDRTVERFYDAFSPRFVRDYIFGNRRVERQLAFLAAALPATARRILVVGSGSGESAHFIASRIARGADVLAIDISAANVRLAQSLRSHPRVTYRQLDVLADDCDGTFDAIVLPDVYEHISLQQRETLHGVIDRLLGVDGRLLITVPSPAHQSFLATSGAGLQIVDEIVTTADLLAIARDVHGELAYLNLVSIWRANDYVHAVIARGVDRLGPLASSTPLQIRGWLPFTLHGTRIGRVISLARAGFRYFVVRTKLRHDD
jgi:SAM-dependent methyltransferase